MSQEEIIKQNTVDIHGKSYLTVPGRIQLIHEEQGSQTFTIETEVLSHTPVVVKATVKCKRGTFTGISAANPMKSIEKASPYEVAETSAVGRALGFANFGMIDSIASADEMHKALASDEIKRPVGRPAKVLAPSEPLPRESETIEETLDRKTAPRTAQEQEMDDSLNESVSDQPEKRECPKHEGATAFLKQTPWGKWQYSHREETEPKGYCNINVE